MGHKGGLSKVMVWAVVSLCGDARMGVKVGSACSEEFEVGVGVYRGSVLLPLLFAVVVDVVAEDAEGGWWMNCCVRMTLFS